MWINVWGAVAIVVWVGLNLIASVIASRKGRSGFGFFLLSVILSPLLAIALALIVHPVKNIKVDEESS